MNVILLATWNGAAYLDEFLESVRAQTVSDWRMLVRDDGSTDDTPDLLARAAARDPRISLIEDQRGRQGVTANFGILMEHARDRGAHHVFFADQDDVWRPDKLQKQLALLYQAQRRAGSNTPLLVHSDLTVVDRDLGVIHPSHAHCTRLSRDRAASDPLRTLLTNNFVTGCTALINRPLLEAALPIPPSAVLHDWWIALCAAAMGEICYFPEPTVLYRQHGANVVGAQGFWAKVNPLTGRWWSHWHRTLEAFRNGTLQAQALRARMIDRGAACAERRTLVEAYGRLLESPPTALRRLRAVRRLRLGRRGALNQLLLAARLCCLPPSP